MDKEQKELEYFLAGIKNIIDLSVKQDSMRFSSFLNESQRALAEQIVKKSRVSYRFYGGFEGAQRVMLGVFPDYIEPLTEYFPVSAYTFTYPLKFTLSHRDFLGALMAQQIKRETIGDIVISEGKAFVFVDERVKKVIETQFDKIGSVGVDIFEGLENFLKIPQKFRPIKGTLPSLRLDAAVSLVTGLSREKSSKLILNKLVQVNYFEKDKDTVMLNEGDIISVRGYGKFKLTTVGTITRKGRISVLFEAFIN